MLADWTTAVVPARTRAALRLLECLTRRPQELDQPLLQELRAAGLDDGALREAANVSFHFNMLNRMSDAFAFQSLTAAQEARHTKMLNRMGRFLKGKQAQPVWVQEEDGQVRPTELARARAQLLTAPGKTKPALRRAVEAYVAAQRGQPRPAQPAAPAALLPFLQKLATQAYKITDKNITDLRAAGYDDEGIYEITVTGAFGAALVGVERLFGVLYGRPAAAAE